MLARCIQAARIPPGRRSPDQVQAIYEWLTLSDLEIFSSVHEIQFRRLARSLELVSIPPRTTLFEAGEEADKVYLVVKGSVTVWVPDFSFGHSGHARYDSEGASPDSAVVSFSPRAGPRPMSEAGLGVVQEDPIPMLSTGESPTLQPLKKVVPPPLQLDLVDEESDALSVDSSNAGAEPGNQSPTNSTQHPLNLYMPTEEGAVSGARPTKTLREHDGQAEVVGYVCISSTSVGGNLTEAAFRKLQDTSRNRGKQTWARPNHRRTRSRATATPTGHRRSGSESVPMTPTGTPKVGLASPGSPASTRSKTDSGTAFTFGSPTSRNKSAFALHSPSILTEASSPIISPKASGTSGSITGSSSGQPSVYIVGEDILRSILHKSKEQVFPGDMPWIRNEDSTEKLYYSTSVRVGGGEPTEAFVINLGALRQLLTSDPEQELHAIILALRTKFPVLTEAPQPLLRQLAVSAERGGAARGEYIFRHGEPADRVLFLLEGTCRVEVSVQLAVDEDQTGEHTTTVSDPGGRVGPSTSRSVEHASSQRKVKRKTLSRAKRSMRNQVLPQTRPVVPSLEKASVLAKLVDNSPPKSKRRRSLAQRMEEFHRELERLVKNPGAGDDERTAQATASAMFSPAAMPGGSLITSPGEMGVAHFQAAGLPLSSWRGSATKKPEPPIELVGASDVPVVPPSVVMRLTRRHALAGYLVAAGYSARNPALSKLLTGEGFAKSLQKRAKGKRGSDKVSTKRKDAELTVVIPTSSSPNPSPSPSPTGQQGESPHGTAKPGASPRLQMSPISPRLTTLLQNMNLPLSISRASSPNTKRTSDVPSESTVVSNVGQLQSVRHTVVQNHETQDKPPMSLASSNVGTTLVRTSAKGASSGRRDSDAAVSRAADYPHEDHTLPYKKKVVSVAVAMVTGGELLGDVEALTLPRAAVSAAAQGAVEADPSYSVLSDLTGSTAPPGSISSKMDTTSTGTPSPAALLASIVEKNGTPPSTATLALSEYLLTHSGDTVTRPGAGTAAITDVITPKVPASSGSGSALVSCEGLDQEEAEGDRDASPAILALVVAEAQPQHLVQLQQALLQKASTFAMGALTQSLAPLGATSAVDLSSELQTSLSVRRYSHSAVAVEPCVYLSVPRLAFVRILSSMQSILSSLHRRAVFKHNWRQRQRRKLALALRQASASSRAALAAGMGLEATQLSEQALSPRLQGSNILKSVAGVGYIGSNAVARGGAGRRGAIANSLARVHPFAVMSGLLPPALDALRHQEQVRQQQESECLADFLDGHLNVHRPVSTGAPDTSIEANEPPPQTESCRSASSCSAPPVVASPDKRSTDPLNRFSETTARHPPPPPPPPTTELTPASAQLPSYLLSARLAADPQAAVVSRSLHHLSASTLAGDTIPTRGVLAESGKAQNNAILMAEKVPSAGVSSKQLDTPALENVSVSQPPVASRTTAVEANQGSLLATKKHHSGFVDPDFTVSKHMKLSQAALAKVLVKQAGADIAGEQHTKLSAEIPPIMNLEKLAIVANDKRLSARNEHLTSRSTFDGGDTITIPLPILPSGETLSSQGPPSKDGQGLTSTPGMGTPATPFRAQSRSSARGTSTYQLGETQSSGGPPASETITGSSNLTGRRFLESVGVDVEARISRIASENTVRARAEAAQASSVLESVVVPGAGSIGSAAGAWMIDQTLDENTVALQSMSSALSGTGDKLRDARLRYSNRDAPKYKFAQEGPSPIDPFEVLEEFHDEEGAMHRAPMEAATVYQRMAANAANASEEFMFGFENDIDPDGLLGWSELKGIEALYASASRAYHEALIDAGKAAKSEHDTPAAASTAPRTKAVITAQSTQSTQKRRLERIARRRKRLIGKFLAKLRQKAKDKLKQSVMAESAESSAVKEVLGIGATASNEAADSEQPERSTLLHLLRSVGLFKKRITAADVKANALRATPVLSTTGLQSASLATRVHERRTTELAANHRLRETQLRLLGASAAGKSVSASDTLHEDIDVFANLDRHNPLLRGRLARLASSGLNSPLLWLPQLTAWGRPPPDLMVAAALRTVEAEARTRGRAPKSRRMQSVPVSKTQSSEADSGVSQDLIETSLQLVAPAVDIAASRRVHVPNAAIEIALSSQLSEIPAPSEQPVRTDGNVELLTSHDDPVANNTQSNASRGEPYRLQLLTSALSSPPDSIDTASSLKYNIVRGTAEPRGDENSQRPTAATPTRSNGSLFTTVQTVNTALHHAAVGYVEETELSVLSRKSRRLLGASTSELAARAVLLDAARTVTSGSVVEPAVEVRDPASSSEEETNAFAQLRKQRLRMMHPLSTSTSEDTDRAGSPRVPQSRVSNPTDQVVSQAGGDVIRSLPLVRELLGSLPHARALREVPTAREKAKLVQNFVRSDASTIGPTLSYALTSAALHDRLLHWNAMQFNGDDAAGPNGPEGSFPKLRKGLIEERSSAVSGNTTVSTPARHAGVRIVEPLAGSRPRSVPDSRQQSEVQSSEAKADRVDEPSDATQPKSTEGKFMPYFYAPPRGAPQSTSMSHSPDLSQADKSKASHVTAGTLTKFWDRSSQQIQAQTAERQKLSQLLKSGYFATTELQHDLIETDPAMLATKDGSSSLDNQSNLREFVTRNRNVEREGRIARIQRRLELEKRTETQRTLALRAAGQASLGTRLPWIKSSADVRTVAQATSVATSAFIDNAKRKVENL